MAHTNLDGTSPGRVLLNKVPEVTVFFWVIKILATTVGETFADFLSGLGLGLGGTTVVMTALFVVVLVVQFRSERTLSIHSVVTVRREAFYWLAVLLTFALGTAAGDLVSEQYGVGYWPTALLVALIIGAIAVSHLVFRANAVLTFWLAYILTRPLGASLGDGLAQQKADGGLGLGTTWTSLLFLATIVVVVVYLAVTKRDQAAVPEDEAAAIAR